MYSKHGCESGLVSTTEICLLYECNNYILNENRLYCPQHLCVVPGCYKFSYYQFCFDHQVETSHSEDPRFRTYLPRCAVPACVNTKNTETWFCENHICKVCRCAPVSESVLLCIKCKCGYGDVLHGRCNAAVSGSSQRPRSCSCKVHACSMSCIYPKIYDSEYCLDCKCKYSYQCQLPVGNNKSSVCLFHECKFHGCLDERAISSDYCKLHTNNHMINTILSHSDYNNILPKDINNIIRSYINGTNKILIGIVINKYKKNKMLLVKVLYTQILYSKNIYIEYFDSNKQLSYGYTTSFTYVGRTFNEPTINIYECDMIRMKLLPTLSKHRIPNKKSMVYALL